MGMVKMYPNTFIDPCLDSNQVVNSSSPSLWQDFLTPVDIPSSIFSIMCSLSKNFISVGAKLEVCQDLSSSECNLHISLNSKRVFYATVVLLVGLLVFYIFKSKFLKIPFIFIPFFLSELLE